MHGWAILCIYAGPTCALLVVASGFDSGTIQWPYLGVTEKRRPLGLVVPSLQKEGATSGNEQTVKRDRVLGEASWSRVSWAWRAAGSYEVLRALLGCSEGPNKPLQSFDAGRAGGPTLFVYTYAGRVGGPPCFSTPMLGPVHAVV